jgi:aerobic carbon-monoxide dehydrogenase large subunit
VHVHDQGGYVGRSVPRVEDRPLLIGAGRYVDDIDRPGQLHAHVVRSDVAHARIRSIATARPRRYPGVVDVVTAEDIPDVRIPVRMMPSDEAAAVTQAPLARGRVRYVGEPIAVVVAADAYAAEDAAEAIEVQLDELDPVLDAWETVEPSAPRLHDGIAAGNVVNRLHAAHGEPVDEVLARADLVVAERLRVHRHAAFPIETRGLVAEVDPVSGRLTVWGPTKVKHFNRDLLARLLGIDEDRIRFIEPDVGGGFGARGEFYPEDFLVPWLALRHRRPVKWVEDRREHFLATNHSREVWCDLEIGAAADGRLLAFRARCLVDQGAYARTHGTVLLPHIVVRHLPGPYRWDGFDIEAASVLTNKTPSGTYRGPGQYEAAFFRERMVDVVAARLGVDPAQVRARSVVPVDAMPYRIDFADGASPVVYDGGDFPHTLATVLERSGYARLRDEAADRRRRGELVGLGVAAYVEEASFGRYEHARVVPRTDGSGYTAYAGVASLGQGVRTVLAQILADELGEPIERVDVVHHDTDEVPQGLGAYASRATVIGGGAVMAAARELRAKLLEAASERLEIAVADLELVPGGVVRPRGYPAGGIPVAELGCEGRCVFDKPTPSFDMGAMVALVQVDADTGGVEVRRLVVCHDVGRMVNPQLVEGQLVGAAVQGLGGALLERLTYDGSGQPLVTSFMDYLLPTARDAPDVDALALELPHHDAATEHPLGLKGAGEGGVIGAGAAIANAVADAVGQDAAMAAIPLAPEAIRAAAARVSSAQRTESVSSAGGKLGPGGAPAPV